MDRYYLKSLRKNFPDSEYIILKREILDTCGISKDVWKNWMNGRTKIPTLAEPVIRNIIKKHSKIFQFVIEYE